MINKHGKQIFLEIHEVRKGICALVRGGHATNWPPEH